MCTVANFLNETDLVYDLLDAPDGYCSYGLKTKEKSCTQTFLAKLMVSHYYSALFTTEYLFLYFIPCQNRLLLIFFTLWTSFIILVKFLWMKLKIYSKIYCDTILEIKSFLFGTSLSWRRKHVRECVWDTIDFDWWNENWEAELEPQHGFWDLF